MAEKELIGAREVRQRLEAIVPFHYHPWLVVPMVGLSCGAFSLLFGGDWPIFLVTCFSSAVAMRVRQLMARHHHSPLINFAATGFIATLLSSSATFFNWGDQPYLAMAASVLLLVPGFPLINAVSDMVKGYFNMGLAPLGDSDPADHQRRHRYHFGHVGHRDLGVEGMKAVDSVSASGNGVALLTISARINTGIILAMSVTGSWGWKV